MKIEVSNGEILDKYSILHIKMTQLQEVDLEKAANVRKEYDLLTPKVDKIFANCEDQESLDVMYTDLYNVNLTLWNIEDQIRECEHNQTFGSDFVELARSVYYNNDERAFIKKSINLLTDSKLVEEKSYAAY